MSERKKYSLLPTTESKSDSPGPVDPPSYSATSDPTDYMSTLAQQEVATRRRRRLRIGFFKLCLVGMIVYALLWPTSDPEHGEKRTGGRPHYVNRRPKNMPPFSFEKHMQGDVEQIIAGTLESKYATSFYECSIPIFAYKRHANCVNQLSSLTIVIALSGIV